MPYVTASSFASSNGDSVAQVTMPDGSRNLVVIDAYKNGNVARASAMSFPVSIQPMQLVIQPAVGQMGPHPQGEQQMMQQRALPSTSHSGYGGSGDSNCNLCMQRCGDVSCDRCQRNYCNPCCNIICPQKLICPFCKDDMLNKPLKNKTM